MILENHMVLPSATPIEYEDDYELEDGPEPDPEYCDDCGEIAECRFDDAPHCAYCFARWLAGDHEILAEKEVRDEYFGKIRSSAADDDSRAA